MSRDLTSGMQTQVAAKALTPVMFYEGEFSTGSLRLWSGVGTITWNGADWLGAGGLLRFSQIEETTESRAAGITVSLNGIDSNIVAIVLGVTRHNDPGRVWFGSLQDDGTLVADPYLAFAGRLDIPIINGDNGNSCTVTVYYESQLIDLLRPHVHRWTKEDQLLIDPTDKGFDFVADLANKTLVWGSYEVMTKSAFPTFPFPSTPNQ